MIWATTSAAFLATALVVVAVFYAIAQANQPIAARLNRLWQARTAPQKVDFQQKQVQRAQRILSDLGKLLPGSPQKLSHAQRLLARAGYRAPESVMVLRGAKILLAVGFLSLVYFSKFYRANPLFILAFAPLLGFLLPEIWLVWRIRQRQHRIRLGLPDALDLLVVCVEAGLGLDQAILRVSSELKIAHPELSDELQLVNAEMRLGKTRLEALRGLAIRTGVEDIKALVAMLIQADRFGTGVAQSLRVHSDDLRVKRRQRAEEQAGKAPVKMVPPLVFFIFPALFVVILGPAVISLVRQLFPALQR